MKIYILASVSDTNNISLKKFDFYSDAFLEMRTQLLELMKPYNLNDYTFGTDYEITDLAAWTNFAGGKNVYHKWKIQEFEI